MTGQAPQFWLASTYFPNVWPHKDRDQCCRFIADGIWEVADHASDEIIAEVGRIKVGDRIALKSVRYPGKRPDRLPRMFVQAVGTVTEAAAPGGRRVRVDWEDNSYDPPEGTARVLQRLEGSSALERRLIERMA